MLKYKSISLCLLSLVFSVYTVWAGEAQTPLEIIQSSNTRILEMYQSTSKVDQVIQQKIFAVMQEVTDFSDMGTKVTAGLCDPKTQQPCAELEKVFIELLQRNAIRKLGHYRADRFEYNGEDVNGDSATVRTTAYYKEDSIQLDYILAKKASGWLIVNYIADGVDTIQNYRRQFASIIKKNSLTYLITRLKKKNEEYRGESQQ